MKMKIICLLFIVECVVRVSSSNQPRTVNVPLQLRYEPSWSSLDTRPIPRWFDEVKIGIFIHWGVFSVPSFKGEWFWIDWKEDKPDGPFNTFMEKNYPPGFTYQDFGPQFHAEFFDPDEWAELFRKAGAKYVVLTSKHHEGYTLWPCTYNFGWNAKDVGPKRDVLGDLARAVRAKNLTFGVYHSLFEWFNPLYLSDKNNSFATQEFVDNKMLPEMKELVNNYKPEILWSDGDWEANDTYWKSTEFLAWLYNESPVKDTILVNDRWGIGIPCKHGDFYSCNDRYNPGVLQPHKWENAMTLDKSSWGFRREANITDYMSIENLLETLAQTISCGGNLLINIGPTKEGTIVPIFQERLLQLGEWLSLNGEAIYESKPWKAQNDSLTPGVWYTSKEPTVYAISLNWPKENSLLLRDVKAVLNAGAQVALLGHNQAISWQIVGDHVSVQFPDKATVQSQWAWVLKIVPASLRNK